jgi:hypothetical protein
MPVSADSPRRSSPRLSAIVLLLPLSLLLGCATSPAVGPSAPSGRLPRYGLQKLTPEERDSSTASSSFTLSGWNEPAPEVAEQARRSETERVLWALWAVAGTTDKLDAEWEFSFWAQDGALTLLSFRRTEEGEGRASPISRPAFLPRFSQDLPTLLGTQSREVTLILEREETSWSAALETSSRDTPPAQARSIASTRSGTSETTHRQVLETARRISQLMTVPRGGNTRLEAQVTLEDYRVINWEPGEFNSSGDGPALNASDEAVTVVLEALLPFTHGLGERTVRLSFEGEHRHGESRPRWSTVAARTLEPLPPPPSVADIHQEYRALHEYILVEFQKQSRETAILAAGFTLEQFAYSIVGGLLLKGTLVVFGRVAPIITSVLARGGKGAVSWFRTLLIRAPQREHELLRQLWMKAETQGLQSLTVAEQRQLHAIMGRLEQVLTTPLDEDATKTLRTWARQEYFEKYNPTSPSCWALGDLEPIRCIISARWNTHTCSRS